MKILESRPSDDPNPRYLDDTLRVALYENFVTSGSNAETEHNKTIYAKASSTPTHEENGIPSYEDAVAYKNIKADGTRDPVLEFGFAKDFESSDKITSFDVENFYPYAIMRYTVMFWLEGTDPQSKTGEDAPQNAVLKLGVEIDAYEKDDNK